MDTKDELLSEGEKYFVKVMQDINRIEEIYIYDNDKDDQRAGGGI